MFARISKKWKFKSILSSGRCIYRIGGVGAYDPMRPAQALQRGAATHHPSRKLRPVNLCTSLGCVYGLDLFSVCCTGPFVVLDRNLFSIFVRTDTPS
jgi:hypothetical protein